MRRSKRLSKKTKKYEEYTKALNDSDMDCDLSSQCEADVEQKQSKPQSHPEKLGQQEQLKQQEQQTQHTQHTQQQQTSYTQQQSNNSHTTTMVNTTEVFYDTGSNTTCIIDPEEAAIRVIVQEVVEEAVVEIEREEGRGLHHEMVKFTQRLSRDLENEKLQKENTEMRKHQERLNFDLNRMSELMFKKDNLIKEQVLRIRQLEESNGRMEIVRIRCQLDENELLLKRKEEELVNKAKIITNLYDELVKTKEHSDKVIENKEDQIRLLGEEKELGCRELERLNTTNGELQSRLDEQSTVVTDVKKDLSYFMTENKKLKSKLKVTQQNCSEVNAAEKKESLKKKKENNSCEDMMMKTELVSEQSLLDLKLEMENFQSYICKKLDILNDALLNNNNNHYSSSSDSDSDASTSSGESVVTGDNSCVSDEHFDSFENYIMGRESQRQDGDSMETATPAPNVLQTPQLENMPTSNTSNIGHCVKDAGVRSRGSVDNNKSNQNNSDNCNSNNNTSNNNDNSRKNNNDNNNNNNINNNNNKHNYNKTLKTTTFFKRTLFVSRMVVLFPSFLDRILIVRLLQNEENKRHQIRIDALRTSGREERNGRRKRVSSPQV